MPIAKKRNTVSIAFYNVENLFDTIKDPMKNDSDFTPNGKLKWNKRKYWQKLKKISAVIAMIGRTESVAPPIIVGLVEVENETVLRDLICHKNLLHYNYRYIHYDSPDQRGVDVALLYNPKYFRVISSKSINVNLKDIDGNVEVTRDVLLVKGVLHGDLVYVLVTHWPSRREGKEETNYKRIHVAGVVSDIIKSIKKNDKHEAKFIVLGDFNDNPSDESVRDYLMTDDLYNPMVDLHKSNQGTLTHFGEWHLFDQIIFSKSFLGEECSWLYLKASIFRKPWMRIYKGKLKGSPFRTHIGPWYEGGYSDHFPVYINFRLKNKRF